MPNQQDDRVYNLEYLNRYPGRVSDFIFRWWMRLTKPGDCDVVMVTRGEETIYWANKRELADALAVVMEAYGYPRRRGGWAVPNTVGHVRAVSDALGRANLYLVHYL